MHVNISYNNNINEFGLGFFLWGQFSFTARGENWTPDLLFIIELGIMIEFDHYATVALAFDWKRSSQYIQNANSFLDINQLDLWTSKLAALFFKMAVSNKLKYLIPTPNMKASIS